MDAGEADSDRDDDLDVSEFDVQIVITSGKQDAKRAVVGVASAMTAVAAGKTVVFLSAGFR